MRILATLAALLSLGGPLSAGDDPTQAVVVRVLAPDGQPAAGAKVWVYTYSRSESVQGPLPALLTADTNAAGELTVTLPAGKEHGGNYVHVRDAAGRVGGGTIRHYGRAEPIGPTATVRLVETADRPGRVVDPAGKPVPGATVVLRAALPPADEQGRRARESVGVPGEVQARYTATADADGRFTLKGVPVGYALVFKVTAAGVGETWYDAPADGELAVTYAAPGTVRVTVAGVDPARLKGMSWSLGAQATRPAKQGGVVPRRMASGTFDGTPELVIPNVVPGRLQVTFHQTAAVPATPETGEPFEVKSGEPTAVTVRFGPAATVTGRVVAEGSRKPVAGVKLSVQVRAGNEDRNQYLGAVETAADGTFTAHGPAGWYQVWLQDTPDGYAQPVRVPGRQGLVEPAKVELGRTHTFPDAALPAAAAFVGRAVLPGDKPAAGATIEGFETIWEPLRAGPDGRFTDKNLLPGDAVSYRVRLGKAVNVPATYTVGKAEGPVTIELSEANATAITGRVTDPRGGPVVGAKVTLLHMIRGVGRNSSRGTQKQAATATADKDGRFRFDGLWTQDQYTVKATADGFGEAEAKQLIGEAGRTRAVPPLVLTRAALAVAGVVVGSDGQPVGGATVFGVDGPAAVSARTGPDGRFTLTGFYDAPGFVFAKKDGHRLSAVPVTPGDPKPVTVPLRTLDAPPLPAPVVSPEHEAAQQKLLRHLLAKMWETHADLGYGSSAVRYMAKIDPAQARAWAAEEEKRTAGKTKWGYLADAAERSKTLFATAKEDADEAIAQLRKVTGETGYYEVLHLGRRFLDADKATAGRLAEEAAVRARQLTLPTKVYALAQAGELAARAGNRTGGEKLIREAVALAEQLPTAGRDRQTMARGLVAARLAPFDWPAAKAMLDRFTDPGEYNRFLSAAVVQLAPTDLPQAKKALDQFRPGNDHYRYESRIRAAQVIAREKPDEAVALVDGIPEAAFRAKGYATVAERLADKGRAAKLIDAAFDLMERKPEAFRSWTYYAGRAGFGLLAAHAAKRVGHPDLAGVVARVLALRPAGQDIASSSADERTNQLVNIAAALALIDPPAARQVLAGVAPPDRFVEKAMTQRRDWLFALALADPDRGIALIDKRFEQAKAAGGAARNAALSGMSELASVLTAADRFEDLAVWASLIRPVRAED